MVAGATLLAFAACRRSACDEKAEHRVQLQLGEGALDRVLESTEPARRECGELAWIQKARFDAKMRLADFVGAAAEATRAIDSRPTSVDRWAWRALSYERLGRQKEAAWDYGEAVQRDPMRFDLLARVLDLDDQRGAFCHAASVVWRLEHCHTPSVTSAAPVREARKKLDAYTKAQPPGSGGCMGEPSCDR